MVTVREIGEQGLLQRLQQFCPAGVVGDDGAVLPMPPAHQLVVTSDVLVDGVHFSDRTTPPKSVGWRSAAANLSDLAAMGATPLGITVGLSVPGDLTVEWVEQLYTGLVDCLQRYGTVVVGGDVCRSPITTVAIAAFGCVQPQQVLRRSAAQPGDAVVVTGVHGASRAGLEVLLHPELGLAADLPSDLRQAFIRAHQYPVPRLDVLPHLWSALAHWDSDRGIGGMDSSDGLADAVLQICRASGVGARLHRDRLPIPPGLVDWVGRDQAEQWTLYGGEDFELVLCLPLSIAEQVVSHLDAGAAIVGAIVAEPGVKLVGQGEEQWLSLQQGFQHFGQPD